MEQDRIARLLGSEDPFETAGHNCFACGEANRRGLGMRVALDGDRFEAQSSVVLDPAFQGWAGLAHGGIVSTLMDEVLCYSLNERRPVFTVELTIRYKKPVPLGVQLVVRARRTSIRGRLMQAQGEIVGPGDEVLATADGKFLRPKENAACQGPKGSLR